MPKCVMLFVTVAMVVSLQCLLVRGQGGMMEAMMMSNMMSQGSSSQGGGGGRGSSGNPAYSVSPSSGYGRAKPSPIASLGGSIMGFGGGLGSLGGAGASARGGASPGGMNMMLMNSMGMDGFMEFMMCRRMYGNMIRHPFMLMRMCMQQAA